MQILSNVLAFIFALGVIVFAHELGHYLMAKAFGIRVLTFSLGFGARLWGFHRGETEYRISWIPLGGYVHFAGQDAARPSDHEADFPNRPRWQRALVLLAGPVMNVVLAILLVAIVFMTGVLVGDPRELPPVVGLVDPGSAGERAGLETGDRILSLDGESVEDWQELMLAILTSPGRELAVNFERGDVSDRTLLKPDIVPRQEVGEAGIHPPVLVGEVVAGSAAEEAGFLKRDAILAVDGEGVSSFSDLRRLIRDRPGEVLEVLVARGREMLILKVVPRDSPDGAMIGVGQPFRRYPLGEAVAESVRFNVDLTVQILSLVEKIFERKISLKASLGGPIEIAAVSGAAARRGFRDLFLLMGFISVNLFIFNLFPIPILDGGQLAILLVEGTMRRDLSVNLKEKITQVGLVMIIMLMAMAIYFDLAKNLPSLLPTSKSELQGTQIED